ncbi:MAG: hypothetical protein ABI912_03065 [Actinomycetota bacterium]
MAAALIARVPTAAAAATQPEILFVRTFAGNVAGTVYAIPSGGGAPMPFTVRAKCPCLSATTGYDPVSNTGDETLTGAASPAIAPDGSQLRYETVDSPLRRQQFSMMIIANLDKVDDVIGFDQGVFAQTFSPDSSTVAFTKLRRGSTETDIWTVGRSTRFSGTGESIVTTSAMSPAYSPDGTRIAFIRVATGIRDGLWIMNADGTGAARVSGPVDPMDPQWSPDGSTLAYVDAGTASPGIYLVPPQGGSPTRIADGVEPAWSSDSKSIVYSSGPVPAAGMLPSNSVYSIVVAGGTPQQLTSPAGEDYTDSAPIYFVPYVAPSGPPSLPVPPVPPAPSPLVPPVPPVPVARPVAVAGLTAALGGDSIDLAWSTAVDDRAGVVVRELEGAVAPTIAQGSVVYRGPLTFVRVPVTVGRTYSFSAFSYNQAADTALIAATRTVTALAVPRVAVPAVTATSSAGLPFPVSWSGTLNTHFRVRYATQQMTTVGWTTTAWKSWFSDTTTRSARFGAGNSPAAVRQGRSYLFDVVALDAYGNVSASRPSVRATVPLDDNQRALRYTGRWTGRSAAGNWQGTEHVTTTPGSRLTLRASATGFVVIGTTGPGGGRVDVYVDGRLVRRVNTYSRVLRVRQRLFVSNTLPFADQRLITLVAARSGPRTRVVIDAIAVIR